MNRSVVPNPWNVKEIQVVCNYVEKNILIKSEQQQILYEIFENQDFFYRLY